VVQSLKSWASKLHPQLPLNAKESQRLLTALTSSFRQQLDQAHPTRVPGEDSKAIKSKGGSSPSGHRELHASSVDSADRHLTSILTNPLLARSYATSRPVLRDYASAQESFLRDPFQDTVELLEEYHKHGAATIPIAALCLEKYHAQLDMLSEHDRAKVVDRRRAGTRTLEWLWQSGLHDTDGFVEDHRLINSMISLVLDEGNEEVLWKWLATDAKLGSQDRDFASGRLFMGTVNKKKQHFYQYRWKGRVFGQMVKALLDRGRRFKSADAALDAIVRYREALPDLPLAQTITIFKKAVDADGAHWTNTNVAKFDRFVQLGSNSGEVEILMQNFQGLMNLHHPKYPAYQPYFEVLKQIFSSNPPPGSAILLDYMERPRQGQSQVYFFMRLLRTAVMLREDGLPSEADWVIRQAERLCPELIQYVDTDLEKQERDLHKVREAHMDTVPALTDHENNSAAVRVPFPSFT